MTQILVSQTPLSLFISHPPVLEDLRIGIIAVSTVGITILLFIFLLVLVLIFYRQRKGSESYSPCAYSIKTHSAHPVETNC